MYYSSGNETVDRMGIINFTGNVIPEPWYRYIVRDNGKPNLNAIIILAEIVYWYRPEMVRDENSGQLLGFKKRFKSDALQRSYGQLADKFGISEREVTNAVVALEKLGLVKRDFRTITIGNKGRKLNNVLYILIDVDNIFRISFSAPPNEEKQKKRTPVTLKGDSSHFEKGQSTTSGSDSTLLKPRETLTTGIDTNTKITTETTTENTFYQPEEVGL